MADARANPVDSALRRAVLVAGVLGQTAAVLSGVLPAYALPVAAVLLWGAARLAALAPAGRTATLRRVGTGLALVAVAVSLPRIGSAAAEDLRDTLGPLLVCVQLAQALMWSVRRELQTGLLVAGALLVLGASYAPDLVAGLPLIAGWMACVVAVVLLVRQRERDTADAFADPVGAPAPAPVATVAGLALAAGLICFLLVPVPDASSLQSRLAQAAGSPQAQDQAARARTYSADTVDTSARGELTGRPLAEVDADSPLLWKHRSYAQWDGRTWSSPQSSTRRLRGGSPYVLSDAPVARTDEVRLLTRSGTVWSPGQPVEVDVSGSLFAESDGSGGLRTGPGTSSYAVSTATQDSSGLDAQAVAAVDADYLELPASTSARTRALAQEITGPAATPAAKVRAVEAWLADNLAYRFDSPVPGPGEDAVDRFLFVDRVGFCEHFAAAQVVLLRAVGIPARFVTGLAYGVDAGGGARTFREKDLHAWVEVPFVRAGWVASDPTAGAAQADSAERSVRQRAAAALRAALDATQDVPGGRVALVAGLLVLVGLGGLWRRRAAARPQPVEVTPAPVPAAGDAPALSAFLRLDRRLAERRRLPAESLAEMRARLGLTGERAEAFAVVERECYAPVRPDPAGAVDVLDRWGEP